MKILKFYLKLLLITVIASLFIACNNPIFDTENPLSRGAGHRGGRGGSGSGSDTHGTGGNDNPGVPKGTEYGDMYAVLRNDEGVPEMIDIGGNFYVQPIDAQGNILELNDEGELSEEALPYAIEVDMGRLNLVRSPKHVLESAFEEVIKVIDSADKVTLDFCGRLTAWSDNEIIKTIDSPRENLAIYKYLMTYMYEETPENNFNNPLKFLGVFPNNINPLMLAASCFAAGSDKSGRIYIDELVYVNGFMDLVGLNPIINDDELDWNNQKKEYFNFGNFDGQGNQFQYNRTEVYHERYIQFQIWGETFYPVDENGFCKGPIFPIDIYMDLYNPFPEDYIPELPAGVNKNTKVTGFARAADDAVHVLELLHSDPYIIFLQDYSPSDEVWPDWPE